MEQQVEKPPRAQDFDRLYVPAINVTCSMGVTTSMTVTLLCVRRYERLWVRSQKEPKLKRTSSNHEVLLSPVATRSRHAASPTSNRFKAARKLRISGSQQPTTRQLRSTTPRALSAFRHQQQRDRIKGHTQTLLLRRNYRSFARIVRLRPEDIAMVLSMPKSDEAQQLRSSYQKSKRSHSRHYLRKRSVVEAHIQVEAIAARCCTAAPVLDAYLLQ